MTALVLAGYLVLAAVTLPKLLRARQTREVVVFCVFAAVSLVLSVMVVRDIPIPNPFNAYNNFLEWIGLHY